MFDFGGGLQELVLIFVIALLVFGPKNLPQLAKALGRAMREFRRASDEFRSTIETNLKINEPDPLPEPPVVSTHTEAIPAAPTTEALAESALNPYDARTTPSPRASPIWRSAGPSSSTVATAAGPSASLRPTGCTSSGSPTRRRPASRPARPASPMSRYS